MSIPVGLNFKADTTVQNVNQGANVQSKAVTSPNTLESSPAQDEFKKEKDKKKKHPIRNTIIASFLVMGVGIALDYIFAKGRHVRSMFGKSTPEEKAKVVNDAAEKVENNKDNKKLARSLKKFIEEGKLDYEIKVGEYTAFIEKGKLKKIKNSKNEEITDFSSLDKDYLEKISSEIKKENKNKLEKFPEFKNKLSDEFATLCDILSDIFTIFDI